MSKPKGRTAPRQWGEWVDTDPIVAGEKVHRVVHNDLYMVIVRLLINSGEAAWPDMIWLSIRRNDRATIRDWRHLQRIKNELVGEEFEGMEMYPAEERLVDAANSFHLFVVDDPTFRWPWGYNYRKVATPEEAAAEAPGAVQRAF